MSIFRFKKFSICDDGASMKVGTDAVLLGAWADVTHAKQILDIGTGCGIIAIMLAQRTGDQVSIEAIELLKPDSIQAAMNVSQSPWPQKVHVIQADITKFESATRYDVIVSNPPYFTRSLLPPARGRTVARHDDSLTSDELIDSAARLIAPRGKFAVILPAIEARSFIEKSTRKGFKLYRHTRFYTRRSKPQERSLMEFGFEDIETQSNELVLYEIKEQTSDQYRTLTGDFYLDKPL